MHFYNYEKTISPVKTSFRESCNSAVDRKDKLKDRIWQLYVNNAADQDCNT